jgi:acetyl-CoA synthetase
VSDKANILPSSGPIVWEPSEKDIANARLTEFMQIHEISDFDELMQRSTEDIAWFTDAILKFLDIQFYTGYSKVIDLSNGIAMPEWCVGGEMNIVHNCLDKYLGTDDEKQTAFVFEAEDGASKTFTYRELSDQVSKAANGLRGLGLGRGDAIGLYMPMVPEIVIAMLAIAKIGGIILPLFSGYGVEAVASRLADGSAKALFSADGFFRRGKAIDMKSIADQAVEKVASIGHMIIVRNANIQADMQDERDYWWDEWMADQSTEAETEHTRAEEPLMIIYTSGTTGTPKGALHTHVGFPIKAAQDMAFGTDVHANERIYWMTDMGWMMGPWLVFGALLLGASFVIYDGAPNYPGADRLWELVAKHRINMLGLSPTLVRALAPLGADQAKQHDLSELRLFASTGEPWNPEPWKWLFEDVGDGTRPIINYSGGTEISGGIVMGNPILPLKATAFSGPCPGIAADIFNENGESIVGEVGELVIKAPWIGMTRGFWGDQQRYLDTYWSRWKNVWVHGDWAAKDNDGLWYILGRSDDTIKVAGKRLGPAEVESVLVAHPDVLEAAAIGVPDEIKGSALVAFCVLTTVDKESENLRNILKSNLIQAMGKALAAKDIHFVSDIPKTRNAKVMRRLVRAAYLNESLGDNSSLVNPTSLQEIREVR